MAEIPFARQVNPMKLAGCYTLDLYCDRARASWLHQRDRTFTGETYAECAAKAKAAGWKIYKDRTATCPTCIKHLLSPSPQGSGAG